MPTENIRRAEEVNRVNRENARNKKVDSTIFMDSVKKETKKLMEAQSFFEKALEKPELLFTEAKTAWGSTTHIFFKAIDKARKENNTGTVHDFQELLANTLDRHFAAWKKERGIEIDSNVEVRNPSSYPSIFAIYVDGMEILQFNIFKQWYGVRQQPQEVEETKKQHEQKVKQSRDLIEEWEAEISYLEDLKKNPRKYVKSLKDAFLMFTKLKRIRANADVKISKTRSSIERELKRIEDYEKELPYYLKKNEERRQAIEWTVPFLKEKKYEEKTEKNMLY